MRCAGLASKAIEQELTEGTEGSPLSLFDPVLDIGRRHARARSSDQPERKVTVRQSRNQSDEKQPRIDTNGHKLIPFIRVYLRSFAVRKSSQKNKNPNSAFRVRTPYSYHLSFVICHLSCASPVTRGSE
jgi:hypothetical protein